MDGDLMYVAEIHPVTKQAIRIIVAPSVEWCYANQPSEVQTGTEQVEVEPGVFIDVPVFTATSWLETADPYTEPGTLVYAGPGYFADPGVPERFCTEQWDAATAQTMQQDGDGNWYWKHNTQGALVFHQGKIWRNLSPTGTPNVWEPPTNWREYPMGDAHPLWIQPVGAVDAYPLDFVVEHNGLVWRSLIPANVWQPGAVGSETLWEQVIEEVI